MSDSVTSPESNGLSIIDWVAIIFFWCLASIVLIQFVSRYFFNDSIAWTEEISRYLLIATVFTGSASAFRRKAHIKIEFLTKYLSTAVSQAIALINDLVVIVFLGISAWLCFELSSRTGARMVSIDLPKKIIYYLVSGGFIFMLGYVLKHFWLDFLQAKMEWRKDK